jgi:hypothetical protein
MERLENYDYDDMMRCWHLLNRKKYKVNLFNFSVIYEQAIKDKTLYVKRDDMGRIITCIRAYVEYYNETPVFVIQETASKEPLSEVKKDIVDIIKAQQIFIMCALWGRKTGKYRAVLDWANGKCKIIKLKEDI